MTIPSVLWPKSEGRGCECDEGLNGNETPGFNLESECLRAQSPGAGVDWALWSMRTTGGCAYLCVSTRVCTVYIWWDGTQGEVVPCEGDPWGEEEEGEATCLLAVAKWGWQPSTCLETLSFKTPSAHPLWDINSPWDPVTLAVVRLTRPPVHCPIRPAKTATIHLRPEAILGHCNTVQYIGGSATDVCSFTLLLVFLFQSDTCPKALCVRLWYKYTSVAKSSRVANREGLYWLSFSYCTVFSKLKSHHSVLQHR